MGVLVLSAHFDPALALRLNSRRPVRTGICSSSRCPTSPRSSVPCESSPRAARPVDRSVIERLRSARCRTQPLQCVSERERGILARYGRGRTNSAIRDALCVSPTPSRHRQAPPARRDQVT